MSGRPSIAVPLMGTCFLLLLMISSGSILFRRWGLRRRGNWRLWGCRQRGYRPWLTTLSKIKRRHSRKFSALLKIHRDFSMVIAHVRRPVRGIEAFGFSLQIILAEMFKVFLLRQNAQLKRKNRDQDRDTKQYPRGIQKKDANNLLEGNQIL